jgi:hypothetical protein
VAVRLNGVLKGTQWANAGTWQAPSSLTIGRQSQPIATANTYWFTGGIAETLLYNRCLATDELAARHTYLKSKYNIP